MFNWSFVLYPLLLLNHRKPTWSKWNFDLSLLIHPGFHKTGTSWLQQVAFADKRFFNQCLDQDIVDQLIVRPHDFDFDPEPTRQRIGQCINADPTLNVVSCEILTGNPFTGLREASTLSDRLFAIYPSAKILLTVRRPEHMVRSIYHQYLKSGGLLTLKDFLAQDCIPGYYGFTTMAMQYDKIAAKYADLFGSENILVLPNEMLKASRSIFFELLAKFTGSEAAGPDFPNDTKVGVSPPSGGEPLMRFAIRWISSPEKPASFTPFAIPARQVLRVAYRQKLFSNAILKSSMKTIRDFLGDDMRNHNAALQEWCPVPLSQYGYDLQAD